jgi:putative ABC transport system permease protein
MLRLSVRGVRGHLVRFLLTALAVTLGVAFVAGSFVLRDSIDATLTSLLDTGTKGLDVSVRGTQVRTEAGTGPRRAVPLSLVSRLASVDGVARVAPDLQGVAMIVGHDGTVVRNGGAPTLGFAYHSDDPAFTLDTGRGPRTADEVAVEQSTLAKSGLAVGDTTRSVIGDRTRTVRIVGEVTFGSLFGATAVLVDDATARAAFAPDGTVASISLTARQGVTQEQLRTRIVAVLPAGTEAVTGRAVVDETQSQLQQGLGFFTTFLLVFAGITLFVGAFIIVNTFSILLAQRTRELALLRAIGAHRGQVTRMVLGEAVLIGLLGSALGLAVGVGLASALKAVIRIISGADISGGLPVHVSTVLWSVLIGTGVTLVSAVLPARRAARIPPVAAMRDDLIPPASGVLRRGQIGLALVAAGGALLTWEVTRDDVTWGAAGAGAALSVVGALVAAPLAARPVVRTLVWPFLCFGGVVSRLASRNALRVPRRTANTAGALMIGLALVAALATVAQSVKASTADLFARQLTADFVLSAGGDSPVPAGLAAAASRTPGVRAVATLGTVRVAVGALETSATASSGTGLSDNLRVDMISGDLRAIDRGRLLVNATTARAHGWVVGSRLTAALGTLTDQPLTVGGVFKDNQLIGSPFVVGRELYERAVPTVRRRDFVLMVRAEPDADRAAVRARLVDLAKPYLVVSVQDGAEYVNAAAAQIDQLLSLLYVLLALSIVIAVLGIINTLALSVVERTREIGLLRAVGLGRGQLSRMITLESVATAVFGAVLGAVLGLGLGTALQHGLRSKGLDVLEIPWATIVTVLVASAVVGVIAAALPALRAVRLNVLQAIATE